MYIWVVSSFGLLTIMLFWVMSLRWQNRRFLLSYPQRTPILTITYEQEYFWGSLGVQWRSTSTPLEQKYLRFGHIEEVLRNSFTLLASPLVQGGTTQYEERPSWPEISPIRESESMRVSVWFPQLCRMLSKRLTSFLPHPENWGELCDWGAVWCGRIAARAWNI